MTVDDAAKELNVSRRLVYKLIGEGVLGHYRFGFGRGKLAIDRADLDAYKARNFGRKSGEAEAAPFRPAVSVPDLDAVIARAGRPRPKAARG